MSTVVLFCTNAGKIYRYYNNVVSEVYDSSTDTTAIHGYGENVWAVGNAVASKIQTHKSTDYGQTFALEEIDAALAYTAHDVYATENRVVVATARDLYGYDGTSWTKEFSWGAASGNYTKRLYSYDDNFAACVVSPSSYAYPIHYNGSTWSAESTGPSDANLHGVSASKVFATEGNSIWTWNGSSWTNDGAVGAPSPVFRSIFAVSDTDVWAVGDSGYIAHYDGTSWSYVTSPTANKLLDIYGVSSSNIFAVGENQALIQYDGSSWTSVPTSGLSGHFQGVYVYTPSIATVSPDTEPDYLYSNSIFDNGDNDIDSNGRLYRHKAVMTRAHFRLMCRRGEYWSDPDLGSRLHTIKTLKDAQVKVVSYVNEALQPLLDSGEILNVTVGVVETSEEWQHIYISVAITIPGEHEVELGYYKIGA